MSTPMPLVSISTPHPDNVALRVEWAQELATIVDPLKRLEKMGDFVRRVPNADSRSMHIHFAGDWLKIVEAALKQLTKAQWDQHCTVETFVDTFFDTGSCSLSTAGKWLRCRLHFPSDQSEWSLKYVIDSTAGNLSYRECVGGAEIADHLGVLGMSKWTPTQCLTLDYPLPIARFACARVKYHTWKNSYYEVAELDRQCYYSLFTLANQSAPTNEPHTLVSTVPSKVVASLAIMNKRFFEKELHALATETASPATADVPLSALTPRFKEIWQGWAELAEQEDISSDDDDDHEEYDNRHVL